MNIATLSKTELEQILSNEDKINEYALSSDSVKSLQAQRDQGFIFWNYFVEVKDPFLFSMSVKPDPGEWEFGVPAGSRRRAKKSGRIVSKTRHARKGVSSKATTASE